MISPASPTADTAPLLEVLDLCMRFGPRLIQQQVSFEVRKGSVFAIMGTSGSGKSTLLKHLIGLLQPASGSVRLRGIDYWAAADDQRCALRENLGVLFQSAALWSAMTVLENVCLPLELQGHLSAADCQARAHEVLSWVGLSAFAGYYPSDLSGGMKKRAGLARAIVAEPPLLFLDEPSAGLDPINSRRLDDLILDIRQRTGCAVVLVSHELPSLLAIADDGLFLDAQTRQPVARGSPRLLRDTAEHPVVHAFLHREDLPDPRPTQTQP